MRMASGSRDSGVSALIWLPFVHRVTRRLRRLTEADGQIFVQQDLVIISQKGRYLLYGFKIIGVISRDHLAVGADAPIIQRRHKGGFAVA